MSSPLTLCFAIWVFRFSPVKNTGPDETSTALRFAVKAGQTKYNCKNRAIVKNRFEHDINMLYEEYRDDSYELP